MAVYVMDDPEKIELLADFTREEILQLLSKYPMTETQLSEQLHLTKAAVGYHLHLLTEAGLIYVKRVEPEKHGILQKYYSPIAALFVVDPERIPKHAQRYFIRAQMKHLEGVFSVFQLYKHVPKVSSETLEKLAMAMLKQLKKVGQKHVREKMKGDAENLKVKVYAEALALLTKQSEWHTLFPAR